MVRKGYCYRVEKIGSGLRKSYPLKEVKAGTIVKALEYAPMRSLDVIDVQLPNGKEASVYSFQLDKPVKCSKRKRRAKPRGK